MLDRQHLSILREVDRLGSLTAAAERLNVTQSALSHTIRKLEERYGVAMLYVLKCVKLSWYFLETLVKISLAFCFSPTS